LNVASNARPTICIRATKNEVYEMFKQEAVVVGSLVKAGETMVIGASEPDPEQCLRGFAYDDIHIFVKVIGLIDIKLEIARINKRAK
jgi:hypothetical protein